MQAPRLVKAGSEKAERQFAPRVKFTNWSLQFKLEQEAAEFFAAKEARERAELAQLRGVLSAEVN